MDVAAPQVGAVELVVECRSEPEVAAGAANAAVLADIMSMT